MKSIMAIKENGADMLIQETWTELFSPLAKKLFNLERVVNDVAAAMWYRENDTFYRKSFL